MFNLREITSSIVDGLGLGELRDLVVRHLYGILESMSKQNSDLSKEIVDLKNKIRKFEGETQIPKIDSRKNDPPMEGSGPPPPNGKGKRKRGKRSKRNSKIKIDRTIEAKIDSTKLQWER
ncbi:MAG: hypothetical protein A2504_16990 [Bdellovibrionales bacterium RIFOXYD12_FULL_39_22]|nr:MAG: hypothetical protein A2385_01340 [Bdellovibrionales bacterium RIFOXYB1_FULL_39_21]OFZ42490.1 MAG: hypothetical protein A2485_04510 [Bdellovibrionales bacterium RIFOXYC12_FULL_39_17]OFZ46197.1 MAG: hypothetical protein A2404_07785 [Bdellovibrionales bacterium RIFOXYC1_FULL_39_130]OFZ74844.1 MAG: hypothetical protein A2560_08395 [Bdellovibrionales bacterium RIFOXYD1_FULL_39_84]OFZ94559.1 MAG: hypothetical protein A2504_16990 [Bdellovibrionales bacterium RIFOXYD12_FULL_39_22]HLE12821.1 hy